MITISIFFIVVVIGMGAVLNANLLHNKSQNMRSIMDNLNFIMEDMSKNIRTGYNYRCYDASGSITNDSSIDVAKSCANTNGWGIAFKSSIGNTWSYYVNNNGNIFRSTNGAADFTQLTPDEVHIDSIINSVQVSGFSVLGAESTDTKQPFVTIRLVGHIDSKGTNTPFSLQTSVSQRQRDI